MYGWVCAIRRFTQSCPGKSPMSVGAINEWKGHWRSEWTQGNSLVFEDRVTVEIEDFVTLEIWYKNNNSFLIFAQTFYLISNWKL